VEFVCIEAILEELSFSFGVYEDHGSGNAHLSEQSQEEWELVLAGDMINQLLDFFGCHLLGGDFNLHRQVHEFIG